jgi:hypothetical protein
VKIAMETVGVVMNGMLHGIYCASGARGTMASNYPLSSASTILQAPCITTNGNTNAG